MMMLAGIFIVGFVKVSQSYVYMKIALLFFLLITHGCGTPASWAARHTTMCLDVDYCASVVPLMQGLHMSVYNLKRDDLTWLLYISI